MKYFIYILSFFIVLFTSCDDEVRLDDFSTNNTEQLVVIYGYISPQDDLLQVQVSKTLSSINNIAENDEEAFVIANAVVTLSNVMGDTVVLLYVSEDLNYQIDASQLAIVPGGTYNLSVLVDGRTYTSSCIIPSNTISQINHQLTDNLDENGNLKESVTIIFDDITAESNRYIVGARLENYIVESTLKYGNQRFVTDQIEDGAQLSSYGFFAVSDTETVTDIVLQVANVNPVLYDNLFATWSNKENKDDPFYEVVIPPNNITGEKVYGVFAGFQIAEKLIEYQ
ncbi:DUF4249 family protein [uncultured Algibacter sp.]|uniref:DUF4249 family protein n=1 Tax=uncultured Algibacter sp. TaxID=298659 RepID=UPI003217D965